ncbi:uroporphyrinogen-III synthase [Salibacterium aidingense]|uniref:uroporphyrinogen-III synthase n=1 Tax=Salibacterium aidingense TaxID=384933 RepID=UPI00047AC9AE|nr:uroporphyrinogen-III synthase [Salibacterium aidingense]
MAKGLEGKKVMIAASRKTDEMKTLIEKQGGEAFVRPLQGTTFLDEAEVTPAVQKVIEMEPDWFIFTTGMGTNTLLEIAEKAGKKEAFQTVIKRANVAARGYKTANALKSIHLVPDVRDDDGTTSSLIRALDGMDFTGKTVAVQLHGIQLPKLETFLLNQGAAVIKELLPYKHIAPELSTLETVRGELFDLPYDAICFTTQMQVHSLFQYAREQKFDAELLDLFKHTTLPAAVGKVTAEALREEGAEQLIAPDNQRMGAMIIKLSNSYAP